MGATREVSAETRPVVILGHTGFVGRGLFQRYASSGTALTGYSSATLDLRDAAALAALDEAVSPETLLYVAAALTPDRGATLDVLSSNFTMLVNLGRYLERHPVYKCVYISSDAVYPMGSQAVTENSAVEPSNFYALAKYTGERILQSVADKSGFPLLIVRPTAIYGPGDTHNSYGPNRFIRSIVAEQSVRLFGGGEENRDHLYIDDLLEILVGLSASDYVGVFNAATGNSRSFGSIVEDLQPLVPTDFEVVNLPRQSAVTHRHFDIRRLTDALPGLTFTPFEDGLQRTLSAALA